MLKARGQGGGLTGQAAIAALLEAVPTGKVSSNELLPFVAEEMRRRAAPKLDIAMRTSQAWQGRLQNQRGDWTTIASEAGLESGQARMFQWMTQWMNENRDVAERFGKWWDDFTGDLVLITAFPAVLKDFFKGGEGNPIDRWLGEDVSAEFRTAWKELAESFKPVVDGFKEMGPLDIPTLLKEFAQAIADITIFLNNLDKWIKGDVSGADVWNAFKSGIRTEIVPGSPVDRIRSSLVTPDYVTQYASDVKAQGGYLPRSRREIERLAGEYVQQQAAQQSMGGYLNSLSQSEGQPMVTVSVGDITVSGASGDPEQWAENLVDGVMVRFENRMRQALMPNN